jgi:structural maintenance of chromosome 4
MKESDLKEKEIISNLKGIKGVLGRLKDLGEVNPKYEIALRSSCNRMNNIIVDTVQNADKVMDFIKKKNIPRTTLIVLEKIKEIPPLEEQPIPYLYKLIDCEEKFKKIFYFALTDTLICENLKEAEKYAFSKKRKRVVTLDGKLIEKSGVMTGGKVIEKIKSYEELEKSLLKMENIKKENEEKLRNLEEMKRIGNIKRK